MFSRAAVSPYPVNKFGIGKLFAAFLTIDCLLLTDFFREPENVDKKCKNKEGRCEAGLLQFAVEMAQ
jgi:hypothetical protein